MKTYWTILIAILNLSLFSWMEITAGCWWMLYQNILPVHTLTSMAFQELTIRWVASNEKTTQLVHNAELDQPVLLLLHLPLLQRLLFVSYQTFGGAYVRFDAVCRYPSNMAPFVTRRYPKMPVPPRITAHIRRSDSAVSLSGSNSICSRNSPGVGRRKIRFSPGRSRPSSPQFLQSSTVWYQENSESCWYMFHVFCPLRWWWHGLSPYPVPLGKS